MDKPREFWLQVCDEDEDGTMTGMFTTFDNPEIKLIHVIEYSAYEALQVQIKALETQREVLHVILAGYISNPQAKKEE